MPRFFIENGIYIETLTDVALNTRPVGSVSVTQKPSADHQPDGNGGWVYVAPDPNLLKLGLSQPKWKIVKAMTQLKIDGAPRLSGDSGAWPTIRSAINALGSDVQAEWEALSDVPRSETRWSYLYDATVVVKGGNTTLANTFLDAVFTKAATYPS